MEGKLLRIARWKETFETSESRKLKSLSWVSLPVDFNSTGYLSMVAEFGDRMAEIYGAWCVLVCVAAQAPTRGTLADSRGRPYTIGRIAQQGRISSQSVADVIEWALREDVGWLEVVETPGESPDASGETPEHKTRQDSTGQDITKHIDRSMGDRPTSEEKEIEVASDQWQQVRPRANEILNEVRGDRRRTKAEDFELVAFAAVAEREYEVDLSGLLRALRRKQRGRDPAQNPWAYFRTAMQNTFKERGIDFHRAQELCRLPPEAIPNVRGSPSKNGA